MSTVLQDAMRPLDHVPPMTEPALDDPGLWSVVQQAHHARLVYPGGPDYRCLIVDYEVDGWAIDVELPIRDMVPGDLDERTVTLEILDDYLSMTVEHVSVVGRVLEWGGSVASLHRAPGRSAMTDRAFTIAVRPIALHREA
jgi:hypothetical protein